MFDKISDKNLPTNKTPVVNIFIGEFCQTLREALTLILLKFFQNIAERGTLLNSFDEDTFSPIYHCNKKNKIPRNKPT